MNTSNPDRWTEVDRYFADLFIPADPALDQALADSVAAGLPAISVSPALGKFLYLLARIHGSRRILEIGTLGGYSTIWLARALPRDGRLITLEVESRHVEIAQENIARANLSRLVEVRLGRGVDSLAKLVAEKAEPFDFIFIDADKPSNADYFQWALKLSRPGTVIVVDNVVRNGDVVDASSANESVQGVRRLNDLIAAEPTVTATAIQTVGCKGYDGFTVLVVSGGR